MCCPLWVKKITFSLPQSHPPIGRLIQETIKAQDLYSKGYINRKIDTRISFYGNNLIMFSLLLTHCFHITKIHPLIFLSLQAAHDAYVMEFNTVQMNVFLVSEMGTVLPPRRLFILLTKQNDSKHSSIDKQNDSKHSSIDKNQKNRW